MKISGLRAIHIQDVIIFFRDEGVNWSIQNGLYLSRSTVKLFKHNDMSSLESLLEDNHKEDQRKRKALNRRFIVVEAIYQVMSFINLTVRFSVLTHLCYDTEFRENGSIAGAHPSQGKISF